MNKEAEINKELIKVLEEKIQLLEEQKVISQKIIDIQKEQLTIPLVVGRSEQLKALLETLLNENMCSVVGDELIEEALKGF